MDRRIRKAALIITVGLLVALVSLMIRHPLAFMGFLIFGALVILIGIVYYLVSIARGTAPVGHHTTAPGSTPPA